MWGGCIEVQWTVQCAMYETMGLLLIEFLWGSCERESYLCFPACQQIYHASWTLSACMRGMCVISVAPLSPAVISKSGPDPLDLDKHLIWPHLIEAVMRCESNPTHNFTIMCIWAKEKKKRKKKNKGRKISSCGEQIQIIVSRVWGTALWYTFYHQNWKLHQNNSVGVVRAWSKTNNYMAASPKS